MISLKSLSSQIKISPVRIFIINLKTTRSFSEFSEIVNICTFRSVYHIQLRKKNLSTSLRQIRITNLRAIQNAFRLLNLRDVISFLNWSYCFMKQLFVFHNHFVVSVSVVFLVFKDFVDLRGEKRRAKVADCYRRRIRLVEIAL